MGQAKTIKAETKQPKTHNLQLDAMKGMAILLVVLGHATQVYADHGNFDNNLLFRIIYSFHMPFFMFLSGAVATYSSRPMNLEFLKRKFYQLVIPFIAWYLLGYLLFSTYKHVGFMHYIHMVILSPDQGLWFLWVLFLNFCVLALIKYLQKWLGLYGYLIVWLAICSIPTGYYGIGLVKQHLPYFAAGYLIFYYREQLVRYKTFVLSFCLVAFPLLAAGWHRLYDPAYITTLDPRLAAHHLSTINIAGVGAIYVYQSVDLFYKYLVGFSGIGFASLVVLFAIRSQRIYKALAFFGLYTLDIYVSHQIFMRYSFGTGWVAVISGFFIALGLSMALGMFVLRPVPILSTIFLGGRSVTTKINLKKKIPLLQQS